MGVLREMTDRAVFAQVLATGRITRAELSSATGISKPTISDAVRRMSERGILVESGHQTGRRGRVGTYYELAPDAGWVLAVELDADGVQASASALSGEELGDSYRPMPADRQQLTRAVRTAVRRHTRAVQDRGPLRVVSLSVASPVDPIRGETIPVRHSPLSSRLRNVRAVLGNLGETAVLVDNDVNFAARAEREIGVAQQASSFGYLYLGAGLGFAFHFGDHLVRGAHGLAGEIGLLPTGPDRDVTVHDTLLRLGFGRPDGALDVECIRNLLDRAAAGDPTADAQVDAIANVLVVAIVGIQAVNDPELLVMGGALGRHPVLLERLRDAVAARYPVAAPIVPSAIEGPVALRDAVLRALADGRELLLVHGAA
jgi:predicted NBD/HSP70 family sugar kinase/biotin operon repressor